MREAVSGILEKVTNVQGGMRSAVNGRGDPRGYKGTREQGKFTKN